MNKHIELKTDNLTEVRKNDERLLSYNIEMTEVTGGTFWKTYTKEQIDGKESFSFSGEIADFTQMADLMEYYPPINLYDEKLRAKAKALGKCWIRVSGSWATKTYYDLENKTGGIVPEGYASILTREQWIGVLDFVKAVGGKLLISVSNCEGDHKNSGPLDLSQAKKIFEFSHNYGVDIDAAEFMNEPNMLEVSGAPKGYTSFDYVRDADIFYKWVKENYPDCLIVGPCTVGGVHGIFDLCSDDLLLDNAKMPLDVFSYHYYNGISERISAILPDAHWSADDAHTDSYLSVAAQKAKIYTAMRDKYVPGGQVWVTESGDAVGGGNTWASTYLDVLRTLNELGSFSLLADGVIFHNTLASSDYGFLKHGTFEARPNYYAALLWNMLMGKTVYQTNLSEENLHIYCHSRKDGKEGLTYLVINNSLENSVCFSTPNGADVYELSGNGNIRNTKIYLNGNKLDFEKKENIPDIKGEYKSGEIEIQPGGCAFLVCKR